MGLAQKLVTHDPGKAECLFMHTHGIIVVKARRPMHSTVVRKESFFCYTHHDGKIEECGLVVDYATAYVYLVSALTCSERADKWRNCEHPGASTP